MKQAIVNTHVFFIPAGHLGKTCDSLGRDTLIRLERGLDLWKKDPEAFLLVTGGIFCVRERQTRPAADIMADWLVTHGVPQTKILHEDASLDTFENVRFSLDTLHAHGISTDGTNITVVSEFQHALRIYLTFRLGYGLRVHCIPIWYVDSVHGFCLEFFVLLHHLLDWRGEGFLARFKRAWRRRMAMR